MSVPDRSLVDTATALTGHTPQTGDSFARLAAPAGASVSADIAAVKVDSAAILIDTAGLNGDAMRGTENAALASVATEARLAELDAGNLPTDVAARATPAQVNTEVSDVLKTDTLTLPAQGAPTATPTMESVLGWLYKTFRNKKTQTATQWNLFDDAGTVVDSKATVSEVAGVATKEEISSGP